MKKSILMAIAIVGILGWCTIVGANDMVDLGTIKYNNSYENSLPNINIDSTVKIDNKTQRVILSYMYSEIDQSAMFVEEPYLTYENMTIYTFVALHIEVEWWFVNDTRSFFYQDEATKQLYSVNIDYCDITIPENPVITWMAKYDATSANYEELWETFNDTLKTLNATKLQLLQQLERYNQSQEKFDNNSIAMKQMTTDLQNINNKYNKTKAMWISEITNASTYELEWRNLDETHNELGKKYDNLNGIYPIYLFFAVIITGIIVTLILKRKKIFNKEEPTEQKIEIDTGYDNKASAIDKFTAGIKKTVEKTVEKVTPKQRRKKKDDIQEFTKIATEQNNIQEIHKKIDGFRSMHDDFQKTIVNDVRGIETRVDTIEKKLEKK